MHERSKVHNTRNRWMLSLTIGLFSALSVYNGIFSLVGFAIFVYIIVFDDSQNALFVMLFSLSFANIFKLSPSAQSLFTFVTLGYVGYQLFLGRSCDNEYWLSFVLLIIFMLLQGLMSVNILRTIKFVANFLFLYFALYDAKDCEKELFLAFIGGVIAASTLAWSGILPNLERYLEQDTVFVNGKHEYRFAGLYQDPNHYCVNIIISLCLLVILYYKKEITIRVAGVLAAILFAFAVMTYSKSAFLMLSIPVFMFFYANGKNARYGIQMVCLIGVLAFGIFAIAGKIEFLSVVLSRLKGAENMAQLTTGRSKIWAGYMRSFSESALHFLVGNGFGARLVGGKAAHNSYIDMIHYLGLIGSFLVLRLLTLAANAFQEIGCRRNFLNYSIVIVMLAMYLFLSELFYVDLPFHFLLATMVLDMNLGKQDFYGKEKNLKIKGYTQIKYEKGE